jgi:homoprotocatechuate degradation regulator HpaR
MAGRRTTAIPTPIPRRSPARAHRPVPAVKAQPSVRAAALPAVSRSLSIRLLRSREAVMRYFRPHLRTLRLTEQQWRVLRVLSESGPMDAGRLASEAVLLPPSVTRIVRDLARRQMLERRGLRDDRRRVKISISTAGIAALQAGARGSLRAYRRIERRFGAQELERLLSLLDRLEQSLGGGTRTRGR